MESIFKCLQEISALVEGGKAFSGVRPIKRSEVRPTFSQLEKQIFNRLGIKGKVIMIGSAVPLVKKEFGDIDTAIDQEDVDRLGGFEGFAQRINQLKFTTNSLRGLKIVSVKFPIYDDNNRKTKDFSQIDIMLGKKVWLEFWSFTPTNTRYKTVYRNKLMMSVFRVLNQIINNDPSKKYALSHLGLRLKTVKEVPITRGARKGAMQPKTISARDVTNTPEGMIKVLNQATNKKFTRSDFDSFETLNNALRKNLNKKFYKVIIDDTKESMKKEGLIVPDEIE